MSAATFERWKLLCERDRNIAIAFAVKGRKCTAIANDYGLSRNRVFQILTAVYVVVGVRDQVELAFELGRNWSEIEATLPKGS